jgi:hypothetical protein
MVSITNEGQKTIWWSEVDWEAEIQTTIGWVTNRPVPTSSGTFGLASSSNRVFRVDIPEDAIRWRVIGYYVHYARHHVRCELAERVFASGAWNWLPHAFCEAAFSCLHLLPEPKAEIGEVSSDFLTNRPPANLLTPDKTHL